MNVAKSVSIYRQAIDLYFEGGLNEVKKKEFLGELEKVYNRGFSSGFYFGIPSSEEYAGVNGSKATTRKVYAGKVVNYFSNIQVAHILMESGQIKIGDEILIMGETTGVLDIKLEKLTLNDKDNSSAKRGDEITLEIPSLVRRNDKVYLIENNKL